MTWLNFLCLFTLCSCLAREPPTVNIPYQGMIRGKEISMVRTQRVLAYLGIPYAQPPLNDLRFAPPIYDPLPSWDDIRNATEYKPACLQTNDDYKLQDVIFLNLISDIGPYNTSEDCLYLNVFVPLGKPPPGGFATIIWFYPGNFSTGNPAIWNPHTIVYRQRVIVVTMSWRLNIMGFFTTIDGESPGNYGLMDQQAAMVWVKNNINLFNGNPNNICLMGYGTGAVSIGIHMINPRSRELFAKVILMSGNFLNPSAVKMPKEDKPVLKTLISDFGCFRQTAALVKCLRELDAVALVQRTAYVNWGPIIDKGLSNNSDPFLPEYPRTYFENGDFHKIPVLTGYTNMEEVLGLDVLFSNVTNNTAYEDLIQSILTEMVSRDLPNNTDSDSSCTSNYNHVYDSVMFFYGPVLPIKEPNTFKKLIADFATEKNYASSTFLCAKYSSLYNDTYVYRFDVKPSTKIVAEQIPDWVTVPHLFDLIYVWGVPYWGQLPNYQEWDNRDKTTSDLIMSFWANFAKYSNPTKNSIFPINWNSFTTDNPGMLIIERTLNMSNENNLNYKSFQFWNEYYPKVVEMVKKSCGDLDNASMKHISFVSLILMTLSFILI